MVLLLFAGLGLAAVGVMTGAEMAQLRRRGSIPLPAGNTPLVSILKPLKGADPDLEENLNSFFRQAYPAYELLFGVQDPEDPAIPVVRRVMAAHPDVPARLVICGRKMGLNPKVNNLANILEHARGEVILISDSNVRVGPAYLAGLVAELSRPGVRLVSSPFRGIGGGSLGALLESLQLNTYVLGGTAAVHRLWGGVCVVGKSMMLRRSDLEAIGGFAFLGQFLAEDQVCGQEIARRGGRLALAPEVVDNVVGRPTVHRFLARHLRWAAIRWRVAPVGYLGELLLQPSAFALAALVLHPDSATLLALGGTVGVQSALAAVAERRLGVRQPLFLYPPLVLLKDVLLAAAWPMALFKSRVSWRGVVYRIGGRTRLEPSRTLRLLPRRLNRLAFRRAA